MAKAEEMFEAFGLPEGAGAGEGGARGSNELPGSACPGEGKAASHEETEAAPCGSPAKFAALPDAHCHVAFMEKPGEFAAEATSAGAAILSVTVTPQEYNEMEGGYPCSGEPQEDPASSEPSLRPNPATPRQSAAHTTADLHPRPAKPQPSTIRTALGLHPWWIPESEQELAKALADFDHMAKGARFIGEVGLDLSKRRVCTRTQQLQAFQHIARTATECSTQAISLHCVSAYPEALSILENSGCTEQCVCIFHWFSGSSDQLAHAKRLGCWFSVGERMLQTKRGREYAKAIPLERLLLETDAPAATNPELHHPAVPYTFAEHQAELRRTLSQLAELRRTSPERLAAAIRENTHLVLG